MRLYHLILSRYMIIRLSNFKKENKKPNKVRTLDFISIRNIIFFFKTILLPIKSLGFFFYGRSRRWMGGLYDARIAHPHWPVWCTTVSHAHCAVSNGILKIRGLHTFIGYILTVAPELWRSYDLDCRGGSAVGS